MSSNDHSPIVEEKQGSRLSKPSVSQSVDDLRDESEGELVPEDLDNKEKEEKEPTHKGIKHIRDLVNDMAKDQHEGYSDYWRSDVKLHLNIPKVMDRKDALTQRQELQVEKGE